MVRHLTAEEENYLRAQSKIIKPELVYADNVIVGSRLRRVDPMVVDTLAQSIADIITTPLGSRTMRRDYGCLLFELLDDISQSVQMLTKQYDTAGLAIEPMGIGPAGVCMFVHELHEIDKPRVPAIGYGQQAARFVERDQVVVFVQDDWQRRR